MEFGVLLDAALSILAVLVLFSLAASAINEAVADFFNLRGRTLRRAIGKLIGLAAPAAGLSAQDFYNRPEIQALMRDRWIGLLGDDPSAIEPRRYAETMIALLDDQDAIAAQVEAQYEAVRAAVVDTIAEGGAAAGLTGGDEAAAAMDQAFAAVGGEARAAARAVEARLAALEAEFNEMMDRAAGWYLRRTRAMLLLIGLVLAIGANVDILHHADRMMKLENTRAQTETLRAMLGDNLPPTVEGVLARTRPGGPAEPAAGGAAVAAEAGETETAFVPATAPPGEGTEPGAAAGPDERLASTVMALMDSLEAAQVRVGWACRDGEPGRVDALVEVLGLGCGEGQTVGPLGAGKVIGWLIIAFGVTLGAQFWFDLFKRLVHLRTSGLVGGVAATEAARPG